MRARSHSRNGDMHMHMHGICEHARTLEMVTCTCTCTAYASALALSMVISSMTPIWGEMYRHWSRRRKTQNAAHACSADAMGRTTAWSVSISEPPPWYRSARARAATRQPTMPMQQKTVAKSSTLKWSRMYRPRTMPAIDCHCWNLWAGGAQRLTAQLLQASRQPQAYWHSAIPVLSAATVPPMHGLHAEGVRGAARAGGASTHSP